MPATRTLAPDAYGIASAARILRRGGLVAFPTETVYGLGADARSDSAVAAIFAAKGRPSFNPLIVHVADDAMARDLGVFTADADRLAAAFWPGPLTLVLAMRKGSGLCQRVTAGLPDVAIRRPAHPVAQALLRAFDGPLAGPSANVSGRISPTRAQHVLASLDGRIDAVIDAGPCAVGLESTIVGLSPDAPPRLLRPGGIPVEAIEACLGRPILTEEARSRPSAPGQLASHYAPDASVRLGADAPLPGEIWVGFGKDTGAASLSLSTTGDLQEAASRLFDILHQADTLAGTGGRIAIAPIPDHGIGRAINDRLKRAAAPRQPGLR